MRFTSTLERCAFDRVCLRPMPGLWGGEGVSIEEGELNRDYRVRCRPVVLPPSRGRVSSRRMEGRSLGRCHPLGRIQSFTRIRGLLVCARSVGDGASSATLIMAPKLSARPLPNVLLVSLLPIATWFVLRPLLDPPPPLPVLFASVGFSLFAFLAALYLIPALGPTFIQANLKGRDLLKVYSDSM